MISIEPSDLEKSVEVLRRFGARRVWLFGSAMETPNAVNDLDLGVEGVPPQVFYRAVGRLLDAIGKPVDLIDLSRDSRLSRHIRSKGRLLYDG
jgi:predicted nucleotidyltransferase